MSDPEQALQQTGDGAPAEMSTREFSRKEVELLKRTIAQDATDTELSMFIQNCKRYGLDPFTGQIHAVKRWDSSAGREVMSVQVGIDGFRLIADRTGKWTGTKGPYWCDKDGEWTDVWLKDTNPAAAKVGVLRSDFSEPRWGIARWDAYVATKKGGDPTFMWRKMPAHMLAKCAEALALRSAFPNDLSGLYTDAEMDQAGDQDKRTYDGPSPDQVQDVEAEVVDEPETAEWTGPSGDTYEVPPNFVEQLQYVQNGLDDLEGADLAAGIEKTRGAYDLDDDLAEAAMGALLAHYEQRLADEEEQAAEEAQAENEPDPEQVKDAADAVEVEGEDANDEAFEDGDGLPF
jgi:phage recombination protein Bet